MPLTQQQWRELDQLFRDHEPGMPTDQELDRSIWINAVTIAGSDSGLLLHAETTEGARFFYLNAIPALCLGRDISAGRPQPRQSPRRLCARHHRGEDRRA